MRITLIICVAALGGCGCTPGISWDGSFNSGLSQPAARPHDDGYRYNGNLIPDNGYGSGPGYCTSNGEIVWDNR